MAASLTQDQQNFLAPRLTALGSDVTALSGRSFGPNTHKGPMVISSNPSRDNLGSQQVEVANVAAYKAIGGVPNEHFDKTPGADRHITYLGASHTNFRSLIDRAKTDSCTFKSLLSADDVDTLSSQMRAYVLGDSRRVPPEYEEAINSLYFPMMVTYTPGEDITITAGNPLIIDSSYPAQLTFGTITIESGGYIQMNVPVNITANQMISK